MLDKLERLDALMGDASMDAFRTALEKQPQPVVPSGMGPEEYAALFNTPLGQEVLADLVSRFVTPPRLQLGEGHEAAFFREGCAFTVHTIIAMLSKAEQGE